MPGKFVYTSALLLLFFQCALLHAQYSVTIQVDRVPSKHLHDPVFIAGSFNKWQPADPKYRLAKQGWVQVIVLENVAAASYEFKFTRGGWHKVACLEDGADMPNHNIQISSDTVLNFDILAWKDDFAGAATTPVSSASGNVKLVSETFRIPQLNRERGIWIYLPQGYDENKQRYPVLYMQDGQNLFDAAIAPYGEWRIDELLDSIIADGAPPCIVVGIANGGTNRMSEYNPYPFVYQQDSTTDQVFAAEGDAYLEFVIQTLKPFIDSHYRTLTSRENTAIAGSSMGGVISYYAALKYPGVFGKAGIFSPAFWTAPALDQLTGAIGTALQGKYFFYMGGKEGEKYLDAMEKMAEKLGLLSSSMIYTAIDPDGKHNEAAWQKWFVEFYMWIMADGYNVITNRTD